MIEQGRYQIDHLPRENRLCLYVSRISYKMRFISSFNVVNTQYRGRHSLTKSIE